MSAQTSTVTIRKATDAEFESLGRLSRRLYREGYLITFGPLDSHYLFNKRKVAAVDFLCSFVNAPYALQIDETALIEDLIDGRSSVLASVSLKDHEHKFGAIGTAHRYDNDVDRACISSLTRAVRQFAPAFAPYKTIPEDKD